MGKCDNCPINYRDFSPMSSQLPQNPVKVIKGNTDGLKHHVLRFNTPRTVRLDNILAENVSMTRIVDENQINQPEVNLEGEGSEYGWKSKQARLAHKYKVKAITEDQCPWELKDRNDKCYIGRKEGGITANSSYIVMRETQPGVYEAFPVEDWFTFTPKIDYTTFNEEEAEEEFKRRDKTFNHGNLMLQKRLRENLGVENEFEKSQAQLKVHDADDLLGDSDDANEDLIDDPTKKRKKTIKKFRKSKQKDEEDLQKEKDDEDNYDAHASREVDYISESDSDDSIDMSTEKPNTVRKGDADLREDGRLYRDAQDSDSDEEETSEMKKLLLQQGDDESGSDVDENSEEFKALMLKNKASNASSDSKRERSSTPVSNGKEPPNKKQKVEKSDGSILTEENVWRYLARKPISTKELISKFKSKKSGLNKQDMVAKLSSILKKLAKQFMKDGKNYFVLKDEYKNLYKDA